MHYDIKLARLLKKYELDTVTESYYIDRFVVEVCQPQSPNDRMVIWGAGEHTDHLLKILCKDVGIRNSIAFIVDNSEKLQNTNVKGFQVKPPSAINDDITTIVVSSYLYREPITDEIKKSYPRCRIVNIYDEKFQLPLKGPFYIHKQNTDLFMQRKIYEEASGRKQREAQLLTLIKKYLRVRDFVNGQRYIAEYVMQKYSDYAELLSLQQELNSLLTELKESLQRKTPQDLCILILDSMRARDLEKMPNLNAFASQHINYRNAYSPSTYTIASCLSMMTGKLLIDDHLMEESELDLTQSGLYGRVSQEGYRFYQYSGMHVKDHPHVNLIGTSGKKADFDTFAPASLLIWNFLTDLASRQDSRGLYVLQLWELHHPYVSGYHEKRIILPGYLPKFINKHKIQNPDLLTEAYDQYQEAMRYVDQQLQMFLEFLPPRMTAAICSDHGFCQEDGDHYGAVLPWRDENIHVPLIVRYPGDTPTVNPGLFGMKHLSEILLEIYETGALRIQPHDFVEMQRGPIRSKTMREDPLFSYQLNPNLFQGYKMIRSLTEKYVLYDNGQEEYYILPNEDVPITNPDPSIMDKYRQLINRDFYYNL
ncbi:sulfatase-like hydrolase/transferase [Cohnella yongneupensis]|uniref:Sulfatase-like hydrolase/transferase n=1 Tax=Cohnella yongneupensis TaxID=425006 RepID=A0ABW0QVW7_9BACL